ncbi:DNA cytosine methyltransferase [Streptacidiphilus albus]|uniref:DNA cytosine methyltransferase n=1 Tax=Streptacidiphilus albus TaxID=105425 RepID=UPI0007C83BCD|nr:DNA cytosine methyltransferase [Streptacidiphilus albus]
MSKTFKIVDLFAGPGGLDLAAQNLGVTVDRGIEFDPGACATRKAAGLGTTPGDVRNFGPADYPNANVLTGGPPCQTFSVAGKGEGRTALAEVENFADQYFKCFETRDIEGFKRIHDDLKQLSDDRTGLVLEPLRWALEALMGQNPYQAIILEQVPTVLPVWKKFANILEATNSYAVAEPAVLHTEQFGVPQTRRRAIMIARFTGPDAMLHGVPKQPGPTHQSYRKNVPRHVQGANIPGWVTMADVLKRHTPYEVKSNYGTGGDPEARGRRRHDNPSATVTGKASRNRLEWGGQEIGEFSLRELGELQTFPADYPWRFIDRDGTERDAVDGNGKELPGVRSVISQQIGNAVPPRFGMHVLAAALDLRSDLLDDTTKPLTWKRPHTV